MHNESPISQWELALPNTPEMRNSLTNGEIENILLVIIHSGTTSLWSELEGFEPDRSGRGLLPYTATLVRSVQAVLRIYSLSNKSDADEHEPHDLAPVVEPLP